MAKTNLKRTDSIHPNFGFLLGMSDSENKEGRENMYAHKTLCFVAQKWKQQPLPDGA